MKTVNKLELTKPEREVMNIIQYALQYKKELNKYEEEYFKKLIKLIKQGSLTKNEIKKIKDNLKNITDIHQIYLKINEKIDDEVLNTQIIENKNKNDKPEIMVSSYYLDR